MTTNDGHPVPNEEDVLERYRPDEESRPVLDARQYQPDGTCDQMGWGGTARSFYPTIPAQPLEDDHPNALDPEGPQPLIANGGSYGHNDAGSYAQ